MTPTTPQGPRRGFTLLELIVVLVVLGLLTAIAIPTYAAVQDRAELGAVRATNTALARAVSATLRVDRTATPAEVLASEVARSTGETRTTAADTGTDSYSEQSADLNYATGGGYIAWAAHHRGTVAVMCRVNIATGSNACWDHDGPAGTHDGDTALAGAADTPTVALGEPTDVTVTGDDHAIAVTWTAGVGGDATRLTLSEDGAATPLEETSVETPECDPTCTWTFQGLLPGDIHDVSLTTTAGTATSDTVTGTATVAGTMSLIAAWANGDITTHPFATWADGNTLRATLEGTAGIEAVSYNMPVVSTAGLLPTPAKNRSADPYRDEQWNLDLARFEDAWCGNRGGGATIAVIDDSTLNHSDFGDRLAAPPVFGPLPTTASESHGTAVTSLIISQPNSTGLTGAAPDATVIPYNYNGDPEKAFVAWRHANNNAAVDIINNSWIIPTASGIRDRLQSLVGTTHHEVVDQLAEESIAAGKLVVAATGNEGRNHVYHPAATPGILSVGAVSSDAKRWTAPGGGSNYGTELDLMAPGGTNMAAWADDEVFGTAAYSSESTTPTHHTAGTSFAAPLVSALAAMIITADPTLTPTQVRDTLLAGATDLGAAGWDNQTGWGMIDAVATLANMGEIPAEGCANGPTDVGITVEGFTQISVSFNAVPGAATHTVTCTPTGGGTPATGTGPTSPIAVTVQAGKAYSCTVTAAGGGTSAAVEYLPAAVALASGGEGNTCGIQLAGNVACKGLGGSGQLGNGSYTDAATFVPVTGITGARDVTVGEEHACAVLDDRTVSCWGANSWGQLGNDSYDDSATPVAVAGLTDIVEVEAGGNHTCARRTDGTVSCWGFARWGANGNGATGVWDDPTPVTVTGLGDVVDLGVTAHSACAVRANGDLWCWGDNSSNELGFDTGDRNDSNVPVQHPGITGATAVDGGDSHLCAIRAFGTVSCWGWGSRGQLGGGTSWSQTHVPQTATGIVGATTVSAGASHSCVTRNDGTAACWGWNAYQQLGSGSGASSYNTPRTMTGITGALAVSASAVDTCVLRNDATISCVGANIAEL